jgi:hypothetical protein
MNTLPMIKKPLALSMTIILTLVILLSVVASASALENRVAPGRDVSTAPSQGQSPTDPAELEAFLDELLGKEMEEFHIAGAAVSASKMASYFLPKATATPMLRRASLSATSRIIFLLDIGTNSHRVGKLSQRDFPFDS